MGVLGRKRIDNHQLLPRQGIEEIAIRFDQISFIDTRDLNVGIGVAGGGRIGERSCIRTQRHIKRVRY